MRESPFDGLRVLDLGHHVAGPYCAKILADLGADVIKVERPEGDPLRAWGPFPGDRPDPNAGGLFRYLNANKRSVILDLATEAGADTARALAADADLVVENFRPGTLESFGLGFDALRAANAHIALVRISNFGQTGPYRDLPATDLVIQAAGAWVQNYLAPGADPVRVGGRMAEFVSGAFGACAAVTAVHAARRRGEATLVDLSIQETLVGTLPYSQVAMEAARRAAAKRAAGGGGDGAGAPARFQCFGIVRCKDGWVGINVLTDAHWVAACRAAGAPEFAESRGEVARNQVDHEAFSHKVNGWLGGHTAEEILEQCQAARIPTAIVGSGKSLVESSQCTARSFFVEAPGGGFLQPAFPYRMSVSPPSYSSPAPMLPPAGLETRGGEDTPRWRARERAPLGLDLGDEPELPFRGLRVLDLGTFWAGPYMGMYLASLGADVIKVESIQRPDGFRFIASVDPDDPSWYEAGALFQGTNQGKRGITLDLSQPEGRRLVLRLVEGADLLVENFAPRVMERFGLDYDQIRGARPDIVMVRMPAFGLVGPWRDYVGWAMAIAQAAGISWLTGDPADDVPRNCGAFLDPAVAMHATVAVQAALAHRRRTGEGQMIEMAQLETAACMCAEPVIEYSMNGRVQQRQGNRSRAIAPQGVYPCRGGAFVAWSVRSDAEWRGLVGAMDDPSWAGASELAASEGRRERADEIDEHLRAWSAGLEAGAIVELLREHGIPVAEVLTTAGMYGEPQLEARGFYQTLEHPVTGKRRYPVWPMRFSFHSGPAYPGATPTLGQHNDAVLGGELGLAPAELRRLREQGVIGERWKP